MEIKLLLSSPAASEMAASTVQCAASSYNAMQCRRTQWIARQEQSGVALRLRIPNGCPLQSSAPCTSQAAAGTCNPIFSLANTFSLLQSCFLPLNRPFPESCTFQNSLDLITPFHNISKFPNLANFGHPHFLSSFLFWFLYCNFKTRVEMYQNARLSVFKMKLQ